MLFAIPMNAMFERIPGIRDVEADPEAIQRRFGVLGESVVLGAGLGILIGLFAYGLDDPRGDSISIMTLAINLAAARFLLPKMVQVLMEALLPISDGAQELVRNRFPGRDLHIGLDSAIAIGAPAVIATSLLLVPITLGLALILPGNRVLPLVDLATIPFIVCMMVPILKGNILRSVLGGTFVMGVGLYIATALSGLITQVSDSVGFQPEQDASEISSLVDGGNPLSALLVLSGEGSWFGIAIAAVVSVLFAVWVARTTGSTPADGADASDDTGGTSADGEDDDVEIVLDDRSEATRSG